MEISIEIIFRKQILFDVIGLRSLEAAPEEIQTPTQSARYVVGFSEGGSAQRA